MKSILDLEPNVIIGDNFEGTVTLEAWKGFQSRQGSYGSKDKEDSSNGEITVYVEGLPIDYVKVVTEEQINAIQYLTGNTEKIRDSLLTALLNELPSLQEIYNELIPPIDTIKEFKSVIGISNIHILVSNKEGFAYTGFEIGCVWDEEHGVGIMMHKDRVIAIGQADKSFDKWVTFEDNGTLEIEKQKWDNANVKKQTYVQTVNKPKPWWKFW